MSHFENISSVCSETHVESSSYEKMSIYDPPVVLSTGFRSAENVVRSAENDLIHRIIFDRFNTPTMWYYWPTFVENLEYCELCAKKIYYDSTSLKI
ncbi:hypothetical protein NPIL_170211 [Nephila pilipes]|uniref:Uncharacterized protein n=1 Tax=Nephila pilipes TaxID=299642 RepID=A0A8X6QQQ3_NEPPI|nr:hypothetical protein NPIL_170211 [Nephila pilipes]